MVIFRYKKGRGVIPITPRKEIRLSDSLRDKKEHHVYTPDPQYVEKIRKEWQKNRINQFNKAKPQKFDSLKILLKYIVAWVASFDMTAATIYGTWKFGKYGYHFVSKVYHEYQITGSYEKALLKAAQNELDQNIIPKLKSISVKNISELAAKNLWLNFKRENSNLKIPSKWDKHAEDAMADTLEQVINMDV